MKKNPQASYTQKLTSASARIRTHMRTHTATEATGMFTADCVGVGKFSRSKLASAGAPPPLPPLSRVGD